MRWNRNILARVQDRAVFFREFLRRPDQIGSVVPSSRFLERRVIRAGNIAASRSVVELGPGTGGITRAILDALPPDASLLSLDINPLFCARIRQIEDPRLTVHCGSALEMEPSLARYKLAPPDVVVSGIPFSTIKPEISARLLDLIVRLLPTGGRFVAYQIRNRVDGLTSPLLGEAEVGLELLSFPPQRVYLWKKNDSRP
jgi:phospholipid N-methyltransferase